MVDAIWEWASVTISTTCTPSFNNPESAFLKPKVSMIVDYKYKNKTWKKPFVELRVDEVLGLVGAGRIGQAGGEEGNILVQFQQTRGRIWSTLIGKLNKLLFNVKSKKNKYFFVHSLVKTGLHKRFYFPLDNRDKHLLLQILREIL